MVLPPFFCRLNMVSYDIDRDLMMIWRNRVCFVDKKLVRGKDGDEGNDIREEEKRRTVWWWRWLCETNLGGWKADDTQKLLANASAIIREARLRLRSTVRTLNMLWKELLWSDGLIYLAFLLALHRSDFIYSETLSWDDKSSWSNCILLVRLLTRCPQCGRHGRRRHSGRWIGSTLKDWSSVRRP